MASEPDPVRVASGIAMATRELHPWLLWAASRSSKRGLQTGDGHPHTTVTHVLSADSPRSGRGGCACGAACQLALQPEA